MRDWLEKDDIDNHALKDVANIFLKHAEARCYCIL
jgi:hypothetical protein